MLAEAASIRQALAAGEAFMTRLIEECSRS